MMMTGAKSNRVLLSVVDSSNHPVRTRFVLLLMMLLLPQEYGIVWLVWCGVPDVLCRRQGWLCYDVGTTDCVFRTIVSFRRRWWHVVVMCEVESLLLPFLSSIGGDNKEGDWKRTRCLQMLFVSVGVCLDESNCGLAVVVSSGLEWTFLIGGSFYEKSRSKPTCRFFNLEMLLHDRGTSWQRTSMNGLICSWSPKTLLWLDERPQQRIFKKGGIGHDRMVNGGDYLVTQEAILAKAKDRLLFTYHDFVALKIPNESKSIQHTRKYLKIIT